jgi:plastocyanin
VTRRLAGAIAAAIAALAVAAAPALATTYRGAGVDDAKMPVRVTVSADDAVRFVYSKVRVHCTSGESVRQGGGDHSTTLTQTDRFRHTIEQQTEDGLAMSSVRGKVGQRRAHGTLSFDLSYEGGECHSGAVEWKAKRK